MNKLILSLAVAVLALASSPWAHANEFADLRAKFSAARESLVTTNTSRSWRAISRTVSFLASAIMRSRG